MTNKLRVRFCEIVRDRALVPEPLLKQCLREEAGISTDGTNFPLIDLLVQKELVAPSEIASILNEIGIHTVFCPICESQYSLDHCLNIRGAVLGCDSCGVSMQFLGNPSASSEIRGESARKSDWQAEATLVMDSGSGSEVRPAAKDNPVRDDPRDYSHGETLQDTSGVARLVGARPSSSEHDGVNLVAMSSGQVLDGRYEIIELLRGHQGVVYKALERGLDRLVAVKVLDRTQSQSDRLAREIDSIGKLSHPNIITILNVGSIGDKEYFVLEYVEGTDLHDMLRAGALDFQEATRIARDLSDALHHAHTRGLIHGSLSPSSIRIDQAGHPYLIDFCLAPTEVDPNQSAYRAPELGSARVADESSDVYSLGAIYCHMVSGKFMTVGQDSSVFRSVLPSNSVEICRRAMDSDPAKRHDSMQDMRKSFDLFLESSKLASRRIIRRRRSRRSLAKVLGVVLLLVFAAGAYWKLYLAQSSSGPSNPGAKQEASVTPAQIQAKETKRIGVLYEAGNWDEAYKEIQKLQAGKGKLGKQLERMSRELDVYFKAKELVTTPQALCRFLVQEAEEFVDSKLFKQLAEGAQLWRLRVTVEGKEAAKVTLFPVDSLTLEIKRDQPVNLGNTPINCPYINQQGYQLEVVRGSGSQAEKGGGRGAAEVYKFPIEFRAPISDPTNTDRTKEIRLNGKIPQGMCVVPAISGSAFAQEAGADRDYLVDQFEVTCADYQKFLKAMKDKGILIPPPRNWPRGEMPKDWEMRPVACVSLPQANWFAFWRGKRIPTKVEWVKAAGGQDQRDYPWGTTFKGVAAVTNEGRFKLPQKVGGRKLGESPYGAQDMSGNVWEMVSRSATDISGKSKILGGSFAQKEAEVTISTEKVIDTSRRRYTDVGFRCVRSRLLSRQGKPLTAEEALADSYFGVALAGLAELAKQGPGAHDKIFSKLSSNKRSVRQAAAFYLMQSDAETLRSLLLKKLAAPDPVDRLRAVRALMSGIRPSLVDLLTRLARDPDNLVRQSVYQALVRFGVPKLQNALLKGVKDELPSVRLNSVQGLCDYPRPEVTAALRGCLTDKDRNVQFWAAIRLLERRDAESLEPIVRLSLQKIAGTRRLSRLTALLPLLGLDRVVDATSKHLQSKNVGIQIAVVQSLTYFGAAQFTPWFSSRIRHAKLAGSCASAISQFPTQGGCKALLPLLSDPKTKPQLLLRITSAMGLARYEPAIPALIALLKRRELNAQFKVNILNAIGMIGGKKAQECLYKIYSTPGDPFQRYVYAPMARAKNPGVIKLLRKLRENYVRRSPQRVPQADMLLALAGDDQGKQLLLKYLVRRRLDNSSIQPALQVLATRLSAQEWSALLKSTQTNARFLAVLTLGYSTLSIDIKVLEDYLAREPVQRLKINLIRSAAKVGITEMLPVIERLMKGRSARDGMFNELTTQYSRLLIRAYRKKKMAEVDRGPKKQAHKKQAPKKQAPKKSSADKAGDQGQKGR